MTGELARLLYSEDQAGLCGMSVGGSLNALWNPKRVQL